MKKTKFRIHTWPEKILKRPCKNIKSIDVRIKTLLDEMFSFMQIEKGSGLAANQVGIDLSLIVAEWNGEVLKLVNPRLTRKEGAVYSVEGCLSFPGVELKVRRAARVWVTAFDAQGRQLNLEAKGALAIILQHEIDHINGVVFIERVPFWKRISVFPQLKKIPRTARR